MQGIAVLRVLQSCGPKVPAFPFLGFAYACEYTLHIHLLPVQAILERSSFMF